MKMFIDESWSSIVSTTFIVLVSISVFILHQKWKNRNDRKNKKYLNCSNPNCVRCTTYSEVLSSAEIKMSQFMAINKLKEDDSYMLRIKSSLNNAHSTLKSASSLADQKPEVFSLDHIKTSPWWDYTDKDVNDEFWKDIINLEKNYQRILEEMLFIWQNKNSLWMNNNTPRGRWSVFHLINQGKVFTDKTKFCPVTYCNVLKMKSLMRNNVFGNVAFSVIEPSTRISKHYGPTNIRLRCHLGLITPSCCELEVAGVSQTWSKGKCLLFDDSYLHGVSHWGSNTDDIRAVLMVDLWHPAISREEKQAIDYVFAPH